MEIRILCLFIFFFLLSYHNIMSRAMDSTDSLSLAQPFFYCFLIVLDLKSMIMILDFLKKMHCLDIFSMIKKMIGPQYRVSHLSNNDRLLSSTHRFWQLHMVLTTSHGFAGAFFFNILFSLIFFYNFILLYFCYRRLIIIIVFSSLSMVSSRWFFFPL